MWILQLNPMTSNAENVAPVCRAETREELEMFMATENVGPYQDGQWHKCFKQGGMLEWFNPPMNGQAWIGVPCIINIGTADDWAQRAREEFSQIEFQIPHV